jgi:foldase protein PrsA
MNRVTKYSALSLTIIASAFLAACGGVPSSDVATVADTGLSKSDFNKWMAIAAKSQSQGSSAPIAVPDAPEFTNCIKALGGGGKGKGAPTVAQAKSQCQAQFDQQKGQVMNLLITSAWIEGQAKSMGISVSNEEVQKQFEKTKTQAFGTGAKGKAAYEKFLSQAGYDKDGSQLILRTKVDLLSTKIRDSILKGAPSVSEAQAREEYAKTKQNFGKQSFDKVRAQIEQQLKAKNEQTTLQEFIKQFQADWKARTDCSKIYIVELCKNAPKQAAAQQPGQGTTQQAPPTAGG